MINLSELAARGWCQALAKTLEVQHILRNDRPYLDRYFVAGWSPSNKRAGSAVFLHHFLSSDATAEVHSHPWNFSVSLILVGGYREERCIGGMREIRDFRPGDVNVIGPQDRHRIDLFGEDCWSLFLAGSFAQPWAFAADCV